MILSGIRDAATAEGCAWWVISAAVLTVTFGGIREVGAQTERTLRLTWAAAAGAEQYEVEVSLNRSFDGVVARATSSLRGVRLQVPDAPIYFWRVRSIDENGRVSAWSEPKSARRPPAPRPLVETPAEPPPPTPPQTRPAPAPHLSFPAAETTLDCGAHREGITLRWKGGGAKRWRVTVALGKSRVLRRTVTQTRVLLPTPAPGAYRWTVEALGQGPHMTPTARSGAFTVTPCPQPAPQAAEEILVPPMAPPEPPPPPEPPVEVKTAPSAPKAPPVPSPLGLDLGVHAGWETNFRGISSPYVGVEGVWSLSQVLEGLGVTGRLGWAWVTTELTDSRLGPFVGEQVQMWMVPVALGVQYRHTFWGAGGLALTGGLGAVARVVHKQVADLGETTVGGGLQITTAIAIPLGPGAVGVFVDGVFESLSQNLVAVETVGLRGGLHYRVGF